MDILTFDWARFVEQLVKIALAVVFSMPLAWEREQSRSVAGLRTFPLVAIASCGFVLVAFEMFPMPDAQSRVIQGLMTGIGFIGGGAFVKEGSGVRGTATAASIWATGAIGGAVAYGHLETALILSSATYLSLRLLSRLKRRRLRNTRRDRDAA